MRSSYNLNDVMMTISSAKGAECKLGLTSTVKEQVDGIEVSLEHFHKTIDGQKKQQQELAMQIRDVD